jgi:anti-sigma B factor antagonist
MIDVQEVSGTLIVEIAGKTLDAHTSKEVRREIESQLEGHKLVVLDLSQLTFIDSSGLGVLLACLRQITAAGGDLKVCGLTAQVRAVFQLTRMHNVFKIHNTRDEAVRAHQ